MRSIEEKFYTDGIDGKKIHLKKFDPLIADKVFIVFHGICEHSGRYANFIEYFLKRKTCIYLADHRGHGLSEGMRGNVEDFQFYVEDALRVIDFVVKQEQKSIFIVAHSMGGLIVTYAYLQDKDRFESVNGIVLSSPAYKLKDVPEGLEKTLSKISNMFRNYSIRTIISARKYISDPDEVDNYERDELIVRKISPNMYNILMKGMKYCAENIEKFDVPVLVLIAGQDKIIDAGEIMNHFQLMQSRDKQKYIYLKAYHELFNDLMRNKVFDDISTWVNKRTKTSYIKQLFRSIFKK